MGCLARTVGLGDVRDVDGMVSASVRRLGLILSVSEREELEAEGLAILCELQDAWDGRGSFAGYASSLLGKRLLTAWHGLAGHSRRRVLEADGSWTGERAWCSAPVVSLDGEMARPGFDELRLGRVVADRRVAA
jgi:hypothetical protein